MIRREILKKAVEKAIANGWKPDNNLQFIAINEFITLDTDYFCLDKWHKFKIEQLLYNHDFAKALWGEEWKSAELKEYIPETDSYKIGTILPKWKWHLQEMVIAEDPVKYLGKNL